MKKRLLVLAVLSAQFLSAQVAPAPVYEHRFPNSMSAPNFTVSSTEISYTTDRADQPNRAAALDAGHGELYVDITDHKTELRQEGTASAWYKHVGTGQSAFGSDKPLIFWSNGSSDYSEGVVLAMSNTGVVKVLSFGPYANFTYPGGFHTGTSNGHNGSWHHFTVTWKFGTGGFIKAYVDGVEVASLDISHEMSANALNKMFFTGFNTNYPNSLYGSIDDMRVFTTALTDTEVEWLYNSSNCNTYIPDSEFKLAILDNPEVVDTDLSGVITCEEAAWFNGTLDVSGTATSDLTGITEFSNLQAFGCNSTNVTTANLSNNNKLKLLDISNNDLTHLYLPLGDELEALHVNNTLLTDLDLNNKPNLEILHGNYSKLTSLDVSGCTELYILLLADNELVSLNIANGNNSEFAELRTFDNPNLTCIQVDDASYSNNYWTADPGNFEVDVTTSYSEECAVPLSVSELGKINSISVHPNPTTGITYLNEIGNVQVFDTSGRLILEQKNTNSIDLNKQEGGIYLIKLHGPHGIGTTRIIKK